MPEQPPPAPLSLSLPPAEQPRGAEAAVPAPDYKSRRARRPLPPEEPPPPRDFLRAGLAAGLGTLLRLGDLFIFYSFMIAVGAQRGMAAGRGGGGG